MTELSSGLDTALAGAQVLEFYAVEIALPSYTLRLVNGSGFVVFSSATWRGRDATYGTLGALDAYEDGVDSQSPRLSITLLPPDMTAAAVLADPGAQGATVSVYYGAINPATGLIVDAPNLEFVGFVDEIVLKPGAARSLEYQCGSEWDRLFPRDDGARLNGAFHKSIWPGELGFDYVSEVQRQMPWGQDGPRPGAVRDVRGTGGGVTREQISGVLNNIV